MTSNDITPWQQADDEPLDSPAERGQASQTRFVHVPIIVPHVRPWWADVLVTTSGVGLVLAGYLLHLDWTPLWMKVGLGVTTGVVLAGLILGERA